MFKALISLVILVFGALYAAPAHAQHFTYAYCNGAWVPGSCQQPLSGHVGPNQWQQWGQLQQVQQQQWQQQQQQQMQQVQVLQAAQAFSNGFTRCQTIGGITGATLGSLAKNHRIQAVILGAIAGGVAADMVCSNTQGQQVMVMNAPQQMVGQQVVQQHVQHHVTQVPPQQATTRVQASCAHDPGTKQGILNLPGHQLHGRTVCAKPGDVNISEWLE